MRRIGSRAALYLLVAVSLAACTTEKTNVDLTATDKAVVAASSRVVSVEESRRVTDGLGNALYYELRFDSERAATVDELDAIATAIWQNSPFEPNAIRIMAVADEAGTVPVDLRAAAAGLEPIHFRIFGQGGANLIGMQKRYGDH